MQGACSNQTVKCIVYTNDIEVGKAKLLEIEAEKNESGTSTTMKRLSKSWNEIRFSDGEEWIILNPNDSARGYRWRKQIRQLNSCIYAYCLMVNYISGKKKSISIGNKVDISLSKFNTDFNKESVFYWLFLYSKRE